MYLSAKNFTASASLVGALVLLSATAASAETLTGQQIADTHVGKCISYWGESQGTECFKKNGVATYKDKSYGSDKGRWQIHGDKMCVRYSKAEETECTTYKKVGDNVYTSASGDYTWKIAN